jgi:TRAP-type transport system periplasmic protein
VKKTKLALLLNVAMVTAFALAGSVGSTAAAAADAEAKKIILKASSVLPDTHPNNRSMKLLGEKVKEKTKGLVEIQVFGSSQLGEQRDNLEQLKLGTLDMMVTAAGPLGQFVPTVDVVSLPYVFRNLDHLHKAVDGAAGKKLAADINKAGFVFLYYTDSGSRNLINNKRPVNTPEDLNGLKIRVMNSQLMVNTLKDMGAIATPMGQGEVYSALQQGVLDGWENSPTVLLQLKLYEVSKYFSWTRHFISPDIILMGKKTWDKLSPAQQKAMMEAATEAAAEQRKMWAEDENTAVDELKKKGVLFNEVKDVKLFQAKVQTVWKTYTDKHGTALLNEIQAIK